MNLKILLLVQLLILVATATRESLENPEDSETVDLEDETQAEEEQQDEQLEENELFLPRLDPSDCQFQDIKKCNQKFKSSFQTRSGPTRNEMELYCNGMQLFMNCLEASTCQGPFIDKNRYVVLQHGMMDKKANLCPNHAYAKLIAKVKAIRMKHLFIDDIGADNNASDCSIKVHKKCVKVFTRNMERNSNMCQDVQSFLTCYEQESPKCRAKITQHFAHLCSQLGDQMLKASEKHRGLMC